MNSIRTTCCVVGGGPAGMMLSYLLARAGVEVLALERHSDFFRDFRGDTVHASTLQVMDELDLLDDLLKLPHQKISSAGAVIGDYHFRAADFSHLPTRCKFIALMPQWDFLNFLAERAKRFPCFQLRMQHQALDLIRDGDKTSGVRVQSPDGELEVYADLVVACDGRGSRIRRAAGLEVDEFGVPIDVLWFRISRRPGDPEEVLGNVNYGKALILINRGDYFQAGLIIRKGSFDEIRSASLPAFRETIASVAPYVADRVDEVRDWDQVKLLTVQINRLKQWWLRGLLCIGDAAHAMSPAGGVGINLAIQDAVAAANILAAPLREGLVTESLLASVQRRREFPARVIQKAQVFAHNGLDKMFKKSGPVRAPWQLRAVAQIPGRQQLAGYLVGVGVRPEHVTPAQRRAQPSWPLQLAAISAGALLGGVVVALRAFRR